MKELAMPFQLFEYPQEVSFPIGCEHCGHTGYKGRTLIAEALEITPAIAHLLKKEPSQEELQTLAITEGMKPLAVDGFQLVQKGITSWAEILRVLGLNAHH